MSVRSPSVSDVWAGSASSPVTVGAPPPASLVGLGAAGGFPSSLMSGSVNHHGHGAGLSAAAAMSYAAASASRPHSLDGSRMTPCMSDEPSPLSPQDYNLQQSNLALLRAELKLVTHDRDGLRKELKKTAVERDSALRRLGSLPNSASFDGVSPYATLTRHQSAADRHSGKELDRLRQHYDRALSEQQALRQQLAEASRNYELAARDAEYSRSRHKVALGKLEAVAAEAGSMRAQYGEVCSERDRLHMELKHLYTAVDGGGGEVEAAGTAEGDVDSAAGGGIGSRKHGYETLRYRYDELVASHAALVSKLELSQDETVRLKSRLDEALQTSGRAMREKDAATRERDGLKQQCTSAIRQWDNALRERNEFRDAYVKAKQKQEEAVKEMSQVMAARIKATKEVKRITEERNSAMLEINRILAERDTVHKEMERLQEDSSTAEARANELEQRNRDLTAELESLRREIRSALGDRDQALRRAQELREGLVVSGRTSTPASPSGSSPGVGGSGSGVVAGGIHHIDSIQRERAKSKDSLDSGRLSDTKSIKERLDDLDTANQELDKLRRRLERQHQELLEAQQEAEVCKRRRDWAFSERDKIVMERESIRQLCDKLRRERDRAVSDQAKALRDADDVRKQKNEANKELEEMREMLHHGGESVVDGGSLSELGSAVTMDDSQHEWVNVEVCVDPSAGGRPLGLTLSGGASADTVSSSSSPPPPLTVISVSVDGACAGRLMVGDQLLRIGRLDCSGSGDMCVSRNLALNALRSAGAAPIRVLVRRRRPVKTAQLLLMYERDYHGITLQQGVYIGHMDPDGAAARQGTLSVGDRLLMINGRVVDPVYGAEPAGRLLDSSHSLTITVRPVAAAAAAAALSTSSSSILAAASSVVSAPAVGATSSPGHYQQTAVEKSKKDGVRSPLAFVRDMMRGARMAGAGTPGSSRSGTSKNRASSVAISATSSVQGDEGSPPHSPRLIDSEAQHVLDEFNAVLEAETVAATVSSSGDQQRRRRSAAKQSRLQRCSNGTWPRYRGAAAVVFSPPGPLVSGEDESQINGGTLKGRANPVSSKSRTTGMVAPAMATISRSSRRRERPSLSMLIRPEPLPPLPVSLRSQQQKVSSPSSCASTAVVVPVATGPVYDKSEEYLGSGGSSFEPYYLMAGGAVTKYSARSRGAVMSPPVTDSAASRTPSDTSIDFCVKSGRLAHPNLDYFAKKMGKCAQSDCESSVSPVGAALTYLPAIDGSLGVMNVATAAGVLSPGTTGSGRVRSLYGGPITFSPYLPYTHTHSHSHAPPALPPTPTDYSYAKPGYLLQEPLHHGGRSGGVLTPLSHQRVRMPSAAGSDRAPSTASVTSHTSAASSCELESSTTSSSAAAVAPDLPGFSVQVMIPSGESAGATDPTGVWCGRPAPGGLRHIVIERSDQQLGISISCPHDGGVFVSEVVPNSLAQQVNLQVGDQILEVCGINLRTANRQMAASVLSQCGDSRRILVQYNPARYELLRHQHSVVSPDEDDRLEDTVDSEEEAGDGGRRAGGGRASGSPTPCNSPKPYRDDVSHHSGSSTLRGPLSMGSMALGRASLTRQQVNQAAASLQRSGTVVRSDTVVRRRRRDDSSAAATNGSVGDGSVSSATVAGSDAPTVSAEQRHHRGVGGDGDVVDDLDSGSDVEDDADVGGDVEVEDDESGARLVRLEMKSMGVGGVSAGCSSNLGIQLVGGNAVGIFVHAVETDSAAARGGLRQGDRILEYNSVDLRRATAEQAACQLAKPPPAAVVLVLAVNRQQQYRQVCDQPGDRFHVRALFDYQPAEASGPSTSSSIVAELRFRKNDVLLVDNTMFNGLPGLWRAWLLDAGDGRRLQCGLIPSKFSVEDQLLKRCQQQHDGVVLVSSSGVTAADSDASRRGSVSIRRSIFRRKSKHQRSSSRESRELASFSDQLLGLDGELLAVGGAAAAAGGLVASYQRVERLDGCDSPRPVVVIGPLSELVSDRLCADYPHMFARPAPELVHGCSLATVERRAEEAAIIDFRRHGSHFQVLTPSAVRDGSGAERHCVLELHPSLLHRLHRHRIYPIVLLLRFKAVKQIREARETVYPMEKVSSKVGKDMFEHARQLEHDYRHVISATVLGGGNMTYLCTQVKSTVEREQSKALWIPSGFI